MNTPAYRLRNSAAVAAMLVASAAVATACPPQAPTSLMLPENQVTHVSDHVWAIVGFPNIGIVVGSRATLVVDTGLGPRNGAIALHEAQKLAKGPVLYLTTTHYHAEHAAGEGAFPPNTILVRPIAQQKELEDKGAAFVAMFSSRSAQMKELLAGVTFRAPDITFDKELKLDLGGVTARLFWLGQAHTKGDEMVDVQPDRTLISGDIVQNKMVPNLPDENASMKGWVDILSQLRLMKFNYVVPDHGGLGDGSLLEQDFQFFTELQSRALELKKQGKSAADAGQALLAEFKTRFPDWPNLSAIPNVVKQVYAENP
ncbi:MAG TPA: MBL fold metallo-hydrolase [Candidatus Acidoferrales bacterium]|jgi:glyoxylase-like metal-dependent hydrolase (beta-lactamase superfamily II)|nr:MBL fold metallo-hydrolase [Candidatus Acidoferrales bacterium]